MAELTLNDPLSPHSAALRPGMYQLNVKQKAALYAAYISMFKEGGLLVPTTKEHNLGDEVFVMVSLPGSDQRFSVAGSVAWVTPANAPHGRTQGIGVRFPGDQASNELKLEIERQLGEHLKSDRPTQTL